MINSRIFQSGRTKYMFAGVLALTLGTGCDYQFGNLFGPGTGGYNIPMRSVWIEVSGTVTAAEDGHAVAGATVEERYGSYGEEARGVTDADGRYTVRFPYECVVDSTCWTSSLFLLAHLGGFDHGLGTRSDWTTEAELAADEDTARVTLDFVLPPTRPITVTFTGRVGLASSGDPIEGAAIGVDWAYHLPFELPQPSTATGADGRYELVAYHFCTIEGASCRTSFEVRAEWNGVSSFHTFDDLEVEGDSLAVAVSFHDF